MAERYNFRIPDEDEELIEWIDRVSDDAFGGKSKMFRKSLKFLKQEREDEIEALVTDSEESTVL